MIMHNVGGVMVTQVFFGLKDLQVSLTGIIYQNVSCWFLLNYQFHSPEFILQIHLHLGQRNKYKNNFIIVIV